MKTRQIIALMLVVVVLALTLAGCARRHEPVTIWNSETLRIKREGRMLYVHDLAGGSCYTLGITRSRQAQEIPRKVQTARSLVDTETVCIETARKLVIVTVKTTGATLFIQRGVFHW